MGTLLVEHLTQPARTFEEHHDVRQDLSAFLSTWPADERAIAQARVRRRRVVEEARARVARAMHELLEAIRIAERRYEILARRLEAHHERAASVESRLRAEGYLR